MFISLHASIVDGFEKIGFWSSATDIRFCEDFSLDSYPSFQLEKEDSKGFVGLTF